MYTQDFTISIQLKGTWKNCLCFEGVDCQIDYNAEDTILYFSNSDEVPSIKRFDIVKGQKFYRGSQSLNVKRFKEPSIAIKDKQASSQVSKADLNSSNSIGVYFDCDLTGSDKWFKLKAYSLTHHQSKIKINCNLVKRI